MVSASTARHQSIQIRSPRRESRAAEVAAGYTLGRMHSLNCMPILYDPSCDNHAPLLVCSGLVLIAAACASSVLFSRGAAPGDRNPCGGQRSGTRECRSWSRAFNSPFVDQVVLVVQGIPAADSPEGHRRSSRLWRA